MRQSADGDRVTADLVEDLLPPRIEFHRKKVALEPALPGNASAHESGYRYDHLKAAARARYKATGYN
jgi:hypothetical protein